MLPHLRLFRNGFSPYPPSQWDRSGTDRRPRRGRAHLMVLVGSARCQTGPRRRSAARPPRALASYDAQATQTTTQQAAANARPWHAHDLTWQHQCAQRRATRSWEALAVFEGMATPAPWDRSSQSTVPDADRMTVLRHDPLSCPCLPQRLGWLSAPDRFAGFVLQHKSREYVVGRTYWREAHVPTGEKHVPTGEKPTYLPERNPRTYRRETHVPTGEKPTYLLERDPRTYRREPTYLPERNYHLTSCSGKDCRHVDFTEDCKKTQTTERVCRMTTEHSGGPPL